MIILKFPNYEERYDSRSFKYKFNKETKLLKIINQRSGFTEFFRVQSFNKTKGKVIFYIKSFVKTGVKNGN